MKSVAVRAGIAVAGLAVLAIGGAVGVWFSERRKREVFPSSQAQVLLNPLRERVMPVRKTLERFGLAPGKSVLEVGPGPGYYSLEASRMVGAGRLVCLDLQRGMLDILARRITDCGGEVADLVVGDATNLPFRDGCIDVTFLVTVLGEIPDQGAALSEFRRITREGGTLGFGESLGDPDFVFPRALRGLCTGAGLIEAGHWRNPIGYTMTFRRPSRSGEPIQ